MHRTFISSVVAAALAITGISSSMAQAGEYRYVPQQQYRSQGGNEAIAAALAGVAALFIIGKTIENNGGFKKKSHPPKHHAKPHRPKAHGHHAQKHHRHDRQHAKRGHGHHRNYGHNSHRRHNGHRANEWHRHGNGHGHKHPHGRNHHRGRH